MIDEKDIVKWITKYSDQAKLETLVVGVSGGVDSAVVSTLCAETGKRVILLKMPLQSSTENTRLSDLHARQLSERYRNVEVVELDLTHSYLALKDCLNSQFKNSLLANANTKSRLRMVTLYYAATCFGGLVVGTGNKVEDYGVGFFTKYGDGGVDISPIADLTKTQVRTLGKKLGVNAEILNAAPTDGLWEDNRSDEDQIGVSYEELEWAMEYLENETKPSLTLRQKEVLQVYNKFNSANKHKMIPIPTYKVKK